MYLMSRLHLTKFVGFTVYGTIPRRLYRHCALATDYLVIRIVWGIICMCLAAPKNFAGFAAVRFLLGFAEGAVSPAFITITSVWYQRDEHNVRTA